jgi:peptidoglycan/LPS O-acetylase OafA/YrhL
MRKNTRFHQLDSLRLLFALVVMVGHLVNIYPIVPNWWMSVEFFFVLSGFVLAHALAAHPQDPISFARARFARLVPLHWLVLLLVSFGLLWLGRAEALTLPGFLWNAALLHVIIVKDDHFNWPSWSIAIEFWGNLSFFYWIAARRRLRAAVVLLLLGAVLYLLKRLDVPWLAWLFEEIPRGIICLVAGYLSHEAFAQLRVWPPLPGLLYDVAIAALMGALIFLYVTPVSTLGYFGAVAAVALLLPLLAHPNSAIARLLSCPPLPYLGALSFSIYLLHEPIHRLGCAAGWLADPLTPSQLAATIGVVLVSAALVHPLFERPMQRWLRSPSPSRPLGRADQRQEGLPPGNG